MGGSNVSGSVDASVAPAAAELEEDELDDEAG